MVERVVVSHRVVGSSPTLSAMEDKKRSLEWQLGYYVGEHIVRFFLPTLSIDYMEGKNVIQVSEEETKEYERIQGELRTRKDGGNVVDEKWHTYIAYRDMLVEKYLPPVLECYVPQVVVENKAEFAKGIEASLWSSDKAYYTCPPDVEMENDELFWLTKILLPRDLG